MEHGSTVEGGRAAGNGDGGADDPAQKGLGTGHAAESKRKHCRAPTYLSPAESITAAGCRTLSIDARRLARTTRRGELRTRATTNLPLGAEGDARRLCPTTPPPITRIRAGATPVTPHTSAALGRICSPTTVYASWGKLALMARCLRIASAPVRPRWPPVMSMRSLTRWRQAFDDAGS